MKKFLWFISTLCIILGLVTGCSSKDDTGIPVARNVVEIDQAIKPVPGESKKQNANRIIKAKILKHIDGDTFRVKLANDKVEDVRFLCIDTPEVHHPRLGLQPFGLEGAAFTAKYAPVGKEVELEMDVGEHDKFKRLVA
jgi:endonuclease YncB( thermonuclease family)